MGVLRRLKRRTNSLRYRGRCFPLTPWWVPASQVFRFEKTRWTRGKLTEALSSLPTVLGRWSSPAAGSGWEPRQPSVLTTLPGLTAAWT